MVVSPSTSHVWIYNTKTNTWSAGPDLPAPRGAGALVKLGNTLHFFGGLETRQQDQGEQWVLNLKRPTGWVADASMPIAVNHLSGVALNGKIYAIGGQHLWDEDSGNTAAVQVYDSASHAWSIAATLPAPRGHIADSTFVLNNRIVIVGGASNGVPALNDVICYMPGRRGWMTLGTFPEARRAPVARAVGGRLIVTTGDPGDVSATDQTWISSRPAW
jgi:N-acetylneuraminic acid mutarotase